MRRKQWIIKKAKGVIWFCIFYLGILHFVMFFYKKAKRNHDGAILVYHKIVKKGSNNYLYKNSSTHHDVREFENEMEFISKWFNVVSMDELTDHIKKKLPFSKPTLAITFDDGYRDNYTIAFPILKKYGLPATIYLTAGLIGTCNKPWVDEIQYALLNTKEKSFLFPELLGDEVVDISSMEKKRIINIKIVGYLKRIKNKKRLQLIEDFFKILKVKKNEDKYKERDMLNWEEVEEMASYGITLGAHTVSHPILTEISLDVAKQEIIQSKHIIEKKLGFKVKHFAIPNGGVYDFSEDLKKFCIQSEFETIVTTEYGYVDNTSDSHFLRRFMPDTPIWFFACEVAKLFLFSNRYRKNNDIFEGN